MLSLLYVNYKINNLLTLMKLLTLQRVCQGTFGTSHRNYLYTILTDYAFEMRKTG